MFTSLRGILFCNDAVDSLGPFLFFLFVLKQSNVVQPQVQFLQTDDWVVTLILLVFFCPRS